MRIAADSLNWHDAWVCAVEQDLTMRRMTWNVEISLWDSQTQEDGDAQPGRLTFDGVESVEAIHDLQGAFRDSNVDWEILKDQFERFEETLRCEFKLNLPSYDASVNNGYAEIVVICRDAWFTPFLEDLP